MNVKGKIEKVNPNIKNPNSFGILVNGDWYSLYIPTGNCPLVEGQDIDLEYLEKQGNDGRIFKNIKLPKDGIEVDCSAEDKKYNVETVEETKNTTVDDYKTKDADKFDLGMAKNGAIELLKGSGLALNEKGEKIYKENVRELFKWNKELRNELLDS